MGTVLAFLGRLRSRNLESLPQMVNSSQSGYQTRIYYKKVDGDPPCLAIGWTHIDQTHRGHVRYTSSMDSMARYKEAESGGLYVCVLGYGTAYYISSIIVSHGPERLP